MKKKLKCNYFLVLSLQKSLLLLASLLSHMAFWIHLVCIDCCDDLYVILNVHFIYEIVYHHDDEYHLHQEIDRDEIKSGIDKKQE